MKLIWLAVALACCPCLLGEVASCPELTAKGWDDRIRKLGDETQVPAASALADLLDCQVVRVPSRVEVFFMSRLFEDYPAARAILRIGSPALPELIRVMKDKKAPATRQKIAAEVMLLLVPKEEVPFLIRLISKAALETSYRSPAEAEPLRELSERWARNCPADINRACQEAIVYR